MIREEMIERMPNQEFVRWTRYYARRRQDDELRAMGAPG